LFSGGPARGQVQQGRSDPALEEAVLVALAEAPAGLRADDLARAPALARLRATLPEIVRALAALHAAGAVRPGPLRRWRIAGGGPPDAGPEPGGLALRAVPAEVISDPAPDSDGTTSPEEGADAEGWAFAARYLRHAARMLAEEERTRIDVFADQAVETVQLLRPRGPWWPDPDRRTVLRIARDLLPGPFQAALARRQDDEIALVWGIRVREPRGADVPIWTPLVVWPAVWRLGGGQVEVEPTTPLPTLDASLLRGRTRVERQKLVEWLGLAADDEEGAVPAVEPPELGRRLGPLLGAALAEPLEPLAPRVSLPRATREGVYNALAIVLLDRTRYGRGAVGELRDLARMAERGELRETALSGLFERGRAAAGEGLLFEPLPLSGSQLDAARDATVQPLTVITGPPGTGKSQVVAAMAATVALSGGTVLIASRNHRALDAVEERFAALGPGWFLRLSTPDGGPAPDWQSLLQSVLARADGTTAPEPVRGATRELVELDAERRERLGQLDRLLELGRRYEEAEAAAAELTSSGFGDPESLIRRAAPLLAPPWWQRVARRLPLLGGCLRAARMRRMEALAGGFGRMGVPVGERLAELVDLAKRAAARETLREELAAAGSRERIEARIAELGDRIRELSGRLLAAGPNPPADDSTREALRALLDELQLAEADGREDRARRAWAKYGPALLRCVPVAAVTNLSAASRLPLAPALFDLLIVDEASQCDISSALPLFARAKRAVVVGDPMQLRHVSRVTPARELELLRQQGLSAEGMGAWLASLRSLFDVAERHAVRRHFLAEHYRCHPDIAAYVSRAFYDGRLHPLTPADSLVRVPRLKPGIHWEHVSGEVRPARSGCWSPAEIEAIVAHVTRLLDGGFEGTIGIATPFREQARRLTDAVAGRFPAEVLDRCRLVASSVHQFQGDARDVVLVSLCLGRDTPPGSLEFLRREARLLNVAVSRARVVCLVFGDRDAARDCRIPHIAALLDHVERRERPSSPKGAKPFQSPWEERLYEALLARGLGTVPQFPVAGRFLDLAVPEVRLDIEVDGDFHRGPDGRRRTADRWRDLQLRAAGWHVQRFWVYELMEDLDGCVERVLTRVRELQSRTP
jgi:very-short-patch-repair endonuclease/energy-coupling factor transporter ATP-binding protein EcfA2